MCVFTYLQVTKRINATSQWKDLGVKTKLPSIVEKPDIYVPCNIMQCEEYLLITFAKIFN